jgi:hypothetical protein
MTWYYAHAGQQRGPVSDEELQALVNSGVVTAATLVWREGMSDWRPYAAVVPPPPLPGAPPLPPMEPAVSGPTAVCAECGRVVAASDTVALQGRLICAACKPQVVQRMIEGVPQSGPRELNPEAMIAALRARGGYRLEIGSLVSRAFDIMKQHLWPAIGVTLLMMLILGMSGALPCAGVFISWLVTGPVMGGLFLYFLPKVRGGMSTVNEAFGGFRSPRMKQLMFAGMIIGAPQFVYGVVQVVTQVMMIATVISDAASGQSSETPPPIFMAMPVATLVAIATMVPLMIVFTILWTPTYVILADSEVSFGRAMNLSRALVLQRPGTWILFWLTIAGLSIVGFLALCVGILFVMPLTNVMLVLAWNDIRQQAEAAMRDSGLSSA